MKKNIIQRKWHIEFEILKCYLWAKHKEEWLHSFLVFGQMVELQYEGEKKIWVSCKETNKELGVLQRDWVFKKN